MEKTYMQKIKTNAIIGFTAGITLGLIDAFVYPLVSIV